MYTFILNHIETAYMIFKRIHLVFDTDTLKIKSLWLKDNIEKFINDFWNLSECYVLR